MSSGIKQSIITEMPLILEPAFPIFAPRPFKHNLNRQTANLLFVNTSPFKLIFKIVPNVTTVGYSIRPEIDYLAPRGCRFIGISMSEKPQPKKEHDFTYKVIALDSNEGFGISASQFWEQNRLESNDHRIQEAKFVCVEPEEEKNQLPKSNTTDGRARTPSSPNYSFAHIRRQTTLIDQKIALHAAPPSSTIYHRKRPPSGTLIRTDSAKECHCLCSNPNRYFWQDATAMRSFFYGFVFAIALSGVVFVRKN